MYTLFELMTLEGWEKIARPIVVRRPILFFFFFGFIMVFTFGLLNMIVACVVDKTLHMTKFMEEERTKEQHQQILQECLHLCDIFRVSDVDDNGTVTMAEFDHALQSNGEVRACLHKIGMPIDEAAQLFQMLDADGSGSLSMPELLAGFLKARGVISLTWDQIAVNSGIQSILRKLRCVPSDPPLDSSPRSPIPSFQLNQKAESNCESEVLLRLDGLMHAVASQSQGQAELCKRLGSLEQQVAHLTEVLGGNGTSLAPSTLPGSTAVF